MKRAWLQPYSGQPICRLAQCGGPHRGRHGHARGTIGLRRTVRPHPRESRNRAQPAILTPYARLPPPWLPQRASNDLSAVASAKVEAGGQKDQPECSSCFLAMPSGARGQKTPWGWPVYRRTATNDRSFCFSAARRAGDSMGGSGAAPLKNKEQRGWLRWRYKQAIPRGLSRSSLLRHAPWQRLGRSPADPKSESRRILLPGPGQRRINAPGSVSGIRRI